MGELLSTKHHLHISIMLLHYKSTTTIIHFMIIRRSQDDAEPRLRAWLRARALSSESLFGRMIFSVYCYNPEPSTNNEDDASDPAVGAVGVGDCGVGAVAAIAEGFDGNLFIARLPLSIPISDP